MEHERSCGCIIIDGGKVLLVAANDDNGGIYYGFPKGHQEGDETDFETALRETKEEVGLDVEITDSNPIKHGHSIKSGTAYKDLVFFLAEPKGGELRRQEEEIEEVVWASFDEAKKLLSDPAYYNEVWREARERLLARDA